MNFVYDLKPEQIENIKNRKVIVLDISMWNVLADSKTAEAKEICELLIKKQKNGDLFCPITAPAIWELRKQAGESLIRTASLMEELSLNIAFRNFKQIAKNEIDNFLKFLITGTFHPLKNYQIYGPLFSYLSSSYNLEFDNDNLTEEQNKMCQFLNNELQKIPLTKLIYALGDKSSPTIKTKINFQEVNIERRNFANGDKAKMKRIETESVARSLVLPELNKKLRELPIYDQLLIENKFSEMPKDKKYGSAIEYVLSFMPIISSYIQVLTVSGYDINRKNSEHDFYDKEIMVYGLSYSTIFAASDKWIKSLMGISYEEGNFSAICFAGNLQELKNKIN